MDSRLISIMTKTCAASAAQSAKLICHLAQQREMDIDAVVAQFKKLLPEHSFDKVNDWSDAERVIARAYFILESQKVLEINQCRSSVMLEA